MTGPATCHDLERFRAVLVGRIGLHFDDARLGFLGEVLQRRLDHLGRPSNAYLNDLERCPPAGEIGALARELTVCETYFFRNREQFQALAEIALPERMRARQRPGELRLLSAGCASGEEAYSIAIVARETIADPAWTVMVQAVDINPTALAKAAAARYSSWAFRDTPPDLQRKWFRPDGPEMRLDETVRGAVRFATGNLADANSDLWPGAGYDVIFCRNVLMYFAPEQMRLAIERIAHALAPGGFLFLGHVETLRGVSDAFHLRHTHGTFYYQRKEGGAFVRSSAAGPTMLWQTPPPADAAFDATWVETIRTASERVATLVPSTPPGSARVVPAAWDTAPVLDLLRQERFADALTHLRDGLPEADRDTDMLLLEAALLAQIGQFAAAEIACRRLIVIDELNAGAHYVLALCREHVGDRDGAGEHDRIAAYLDPAFAMPRLHRGLLARRAGDPDTARRELGQALILLRREDAARLLLFGGGFNRGTLVSLCETAFRDCGGQT
ncbi:MAG: CheR family methyltransferase [Aliidongia sp.]